MNLPLSQSNQSNLLRPRRLELTLLNKVLKTAVANYKQSVKDSDDSVMRRDCVSSYSNAKQKIPNLNQTTGFLLASSAITKSLLCRIRGIAKMSVNYFYAAWDKSTTLTKNFPSMLYLFDFKYLLGGLSDLKILVSVVRFRPGPPRISGTYRTHALRPVPTTWFTPLPSHPQYFHRLA